MLLYLCVPVTSDLVQCGVGRRVARLPARSQQRRHRRERHHSPKGRALRGEPRQAPPQLVRERRLGREGGGEALGGLPQEERVGESAAGVHHCRARRDSRGRRRAESTRPG
eukprot:9493112-Pyramimonas_sp.AAC.2